MERPGRRARHVQDESLVSSRLRDGLSHYVVSAPAESIKGFGPQTDEEARRAAVTDLGREAFEMRVRAGQWPLREVVVAPAVPVIYLGDRDAYASSPQRVVTVGLNPSPTEFPSDDVFSRFPLAREADGADGSYLAALDTYFKTNPDKRRFASHEALLRGLDASYYPGAENTALHTNLCSPYATDPRWSRIGYDARAMLAGQGVPLWHRLVALLRPDIVLISVARKHLDLIELEAGEWFEISRLEEGRHRPYVTRGRWVDVGGEHHSLLVFGTAGSRPFGPVSDVHKTGIGGRISACLREQGS